MKTLREKIGQHKARKLIDNELNRLMKFARKHGLHAAAAVIDSGGKDIPSIDNKASRIYGPNVYSAFICAIQIIDRAVPSVPPNLIVEVMNALRKNLDALEQEYWNRLNKEQS